MSTVETSKDENEEDPLSSFSEEQPDFLTDFDNFKPAQKANPNRLSLSAKFHQLPKQQLLPVFDMKAVKARRIGSPMKSGSPLIYPIPT